MASLKFSRTVAALFDLIAKNNIQLEWVDCAHCGRTVPDDERAISENGICVECGSGLTWTDEGNVYRQAIANRFVIYLTVKGRYELLDHNQTPAINGIVGQFGTLAAAKEAAHVIVISGQ